MSKSSVIIIGAGRGGFATGIYAQMNGYQCRIFEHAQHPGGVAAEWNRQGAFEGFAVIDKIFTTRVKRTLPGLNNFLMAGQWVVPGGGVIPTLVSGKHAAMLLCRRDAKPFCTSS